MTFTINFINDMLQARAKARAKRARRMRHAHSKPRDNNRPHILTTQYNVTIGQQD
jgi:hypothetical protein